jgi:hypothetical protein
VAKGALGFGRFFGVMVDVAQRVSFLERARNADGGWGYFAGKESRVEPTVYALRATREDSAGVEFLLRCQEKDGGIRPALGIPGSTWVTALALPILARTQRKAELVRAANWLIETTGADTGWLVRVMYFMGKSTVDQNPQLKGWPWVPGNHSWVEPTAHALVALRAIEGLVDRQALQYRREQGASLLRDRRCSDLGWNYGNKKVLDEVLPSYPETTGIALVGLAAAGKASAEELEAASKVFADAKGAYAKAWLSLGLRLHGVAAPYEAANEVHPSGNVALTALEVLAAKAEVAW